MNRLVIGVVLICGVAQGSPAGAALRFDADGVRASRGPSLCRESWIGGCDMQPGDCPECGVFEGEAPSSVLADRYNPLRSGESPAADEIVTREEEALDKKAQDLGDYTISYLGNAHIDMAWLWRKDETVQVCRDTWGQALKFMEEFPEFTFAQSRAAAYLWMKELYPEIYAGIRKFAKEGRWEVVGGAWVESDCNMPCGESHVRQYLYGKRFFQKEFGVDVKVAWYPDTFGFNWNLPQIMKKAGIEYFMTTKINWNDTTRFPHNLFRWRAPDGSEVLSFLTIGGYGSHVDLEAEYKDAVELKERTGFADLLQLYGVGDHGGGPSRKDIETALDVAKSPALARVRMATAKEWFDQVAASGVDLPVWDDELYLETHRGCQTTQGRTKRNNRRGEAALMDTEKLASLAWLDGGEYPSQRIEEAWRILLFNQFHDILPGSSIAPVYEDAEADYARMFAVSDEVRDKAISHLGWNDRPLRAGDTFVVVNTLSWPRTDIAHIKTADDVHVVDSEGEAVPCQRVDPDTIIFVAEDVPSVGWRAYRLEAGAPSTDGGELQATETTLGSRFFSIALDAETGTLAAVRDKRLDWEVLAPGERGNVLQLFDDNPAEWDAWNIGLGEMTEVSDVREMRVTESGPVRATVRVVRSNGTSTVTQDLSIYSGVPRIDFRTQIDWHEKHKMLKAAFALNVDADKAWYEIPFAAIPRANKPKTEAEKAKWEVAALRWASLSSSGRCASLLNDSKYGYDCKDSVLRLSLLRAPTDPDAHADEGEHSLTYSLCTSPGDWRDGTVRAGRELNTPLLMFVGEAGSAARRSCFAVEPGNVILEAVKKAEDSDALVLRLFEFAGEDCTARLKLPKPAKRAVETDLLERENGPLGLDGDTVVVPMGHNSIATVKVEF